MAPTEVIVEWQTSQIIHCLLDDEDDVECRMFESGLETDGPPLTAQCNVHDDSFDPVVIADRLRHVADSLNEDFKFQAALSELKQAAAKEAAEAAFSHCVEAFCQTQVSQKAEVAPEMQLIRASVALGLYVKKSSPDLKNKVKNAMTAFLNRRVGTWVTQQGGWDKVDI